MIEEINNYIKKINNSFPEIYKTCSKPNNGIYILLDVEDYNNNFANVHEAFVGGKNNDVIFDKDNIIGKCRELNFYSECISSEKYVDSKKQISSSSPFSIIFNTYNLTRKVKKSYTGVTGVKSRFDDYFKATKEFFTEDSEKDYSQKLENYCLNYLDTYLTKKNLLDGEYFKEKSIIGPNIESNIGPNIELLTGYTIRIYLNINIDYYKKSFYEYLKNYIFVKNDYNYTKDSIEYGVPSFFTTYNDKKPYLSHINASFKHNKKVIFDEAVNLFHFLKLTKNKSLPNPLPIFIYEDELNERVVKIYNDNNVLSYSGIIKEIYNNRQNDINNYYLLNYSNDGINDFDYVSSFRYKLEPPIEIANLFWKENIPIFINDIFSFEKEIFNKIFDLNADNQINYFKDLKLKDSTLMMNLLKYRNAIYDYVYKSREQSITQMMFNNLMVSMILNCIRNDKFKNNKHTKDFSIKEKLNIWYNLYEFFTNQNNKNMAQKISYLQENNRLIAETERHIVNDEEFAFASGQVIYYLLSQSESSNRTHALLEPFLQKTDITLFKSAIINLFNKYKHNIYFKQSKFEKLMSEVLSYEPEIAIKELMPFILAGYFSENNMYSKNKDESKSELNTPKILQKN